MEAPHAIGEVAEHFRAVIADGGDPEALRPELLERAFQLHELGLAVGSPIGRAVAVEKRALRSLHRLEVPDLAVQVPEAKVRNPGSDLDPGAEVRVERVVGIERLLSQDRRGQSHGG